MVDKKYEFTQNRELSWLRFNKRVLEEAADPRVPLLERLKFSAIFTSNLDEFFMIRCGSLYDLSLLDDVEPDKKSGMSPKEQLHAIFKECQELYKLRDDTMKEIDQTLYSLHMSSINFKLLNKKQYKFISHYFDTQIFPLLSPQIIDSHHPFPHLVNKEQYIFLELEEGKTIRYGIVPIPNFLDRIIYLPESEHYYMLVEQVILHFVEKLFNDTIRFKTIIRVTRNADINLDERQMDDDDDYRLQMKKILKLRNRLSPIRLEVFKEISDSSKRYLCDHLDLKENQVFISKAPLELSHVYTLIDQAPNILKEPLLYTPFHPQPSPMLNEEYPLIPQILQKDVMLSYPYEDVGVFVKLLQEASKDPNVVSIKITIYRLAGHSKILRALTRAAENGKDVTVLLELRARFDEQNNIDAAEVLEEAGCHILYGFEDYKVHSKICLITYRSRNGIRYITQIGTGNYNEKTSRLYTDFSYITARNEIGEDAVAFFQNMATNNLHGEYKHLWVAPSNLKKEILNNIDKQIEAAKQGRPAQIRLKMNSLTDLDIIKKLAEASQAGVFITMVIRGICCLLPQIKGKTDNIRVISIVGRYLEHSRIYCFGQEDDMKIYISSADFMTRNTEKRVEIACPIYDLKLQKVLLDYFDGLLKDNVKARILQSDGTYKAVGQEYDPYDSQEQCMKIAIERAKNVPIIKVPWWKKIFHK